MFDEEEVALGNGVHNPACIVTERGAYSLATYMSRMERNPSASRQKSTLTQLLDAVAYLHGRSMVRGHYENSRPTSIKGDFQQRQPCIFHHVR